MTSFIMSHWVSYMLLFTMMVFVGCVQWMRQHHLERAPKRESKA